MHGAEGTLCSVVERSDGLGLDAAPAAKYTAKSRTGGGGGVLNHARNLEACRVNN